MVIQHSQRTKLYIVYMSRAACIAILYNQLQLLFEKRKIRLNTTKNIYFF